MSTSTSSLPIKDVNGVPTITATDAKKHLSEIAAIVDVREDSEVKAEGMIPNAIHIPVGSITSNPNPEQLQKFKGKPILMYCKGGVRSAKAAVALNSHGHKALSLENGYKTWNS